MSKDKQWAVENGYKRPFQALVAMPAKQRNLIRMTLNFSFADDSVGKPEREAKEILNCHLKGITARLHNRWEQINPLQANLTWREILIRIIEEHLNKYYPADSTEEELEVIIAKELLYKTHRISRSDSDSLPTRGAKMIYKKAGIVIETINDIGGILDRLLGSDDAPAVNAVLSICLNLHPQLVNDNR